MGRRSENMEVESIIGKETQFKGTLEGKGSIRIEGKVDGKIEVEGDVSMGENAMIKADIKAGSITISGTVEGNIDCKALEIQRKNRKGKLLGEIVVDGGFIEEKTLREALFAQKTKKGWLAKHLVL